MEPDETADAYREARRTGNDTLCQQITAEVVDRYNTRTTDGSELYALQQANLDTPLAQPN
ncbi:hypothetical protein [Kitasatospora sp. NPDC004272]